MIKHLLPLVLLGACPASVAAERPNVLVVIVDDLGYHDLGVTGSTTHRTPVLDRLASEGMLLADAHAAFPRCVPSRFAMLTGVHPSRAEGRGESVGDMRPEYVTVGEAMREAGYATCYVGKWHLGHEADRWPAAQGFETSVGAGSAGATASHLPPYGSEKDLVGPDLLEPEPGEYLADHLTRRTIDWLGTTGDRPFFAILAHYAVHTPLEGPPELVREYRRRFEEAGIAEARFETGPDGRERVSQNHPEYAAMLEATDASIGRVLDALDRLGKAENTIVIVTSDHGGLSNSGPDNRRDLATSNRPLRAGKGHLYQGGLRVPVIVRWPGRVAPGSRGDFPITGMDYYPTILEMAGLPPRPDDHVDGVSFVPGLLGDAALNRDRPFFWYSNQGRRASTGDWNGGVLRRGDWKLVDLYDQGRVELYDLSADLSERDDLAAARPELRDAMLAELAAWKREMGVRDRRQRR